MISIIVPVYNVENYLKPCLDSILASTYQDFELILVDDGSPDNCGKICDEYAIRDSRIRVIHKQNGGLSDARNAGLNVAAGEYIAFVDSDDLIHTRMLEVLYDAITSGDYDFSMIYAKKIVEQEADSIDFKQFILKRKKKLVELLPYSYFKELCGLNYQYHVATNKLYKKSRISDWRFQDIISEDMEWSTRLCLGMSRGALVKAELYYYIDRKGSIMNSGFNRGTVDRIKTYKHCLDDIPVDNHLWRSKMLKLLYSMMLYSRRLCENSIYQEEVNALVDEIYQETIQEFKNSDIGWFSKKRSITGYKYPGPYNYITAILERGKILLIKLKAKFFKCVLVL